MLTIDSKLAMLDCLKGEATQAKLADEYRIGTSTVWRDQERRGQDKIVRINDGWNGHEQERTQGNAFE